MSNPTFEGKRRSPMEAIRAFCVWCAGSTHEVTGCPATTCAFHSYRHGTIPPGGNRSLVGIIKARCEDCIPGGAAGCDAFQPFEHHQPCPCWPFRQGNNPNIGAEQREKLRAHGKKAGFQPGSQPDSGCRMERMSFLDMLG